MMTLKNMRIIAGIRGTTPPRLEIIPTYIATITNHIIPIHNTHT
jgi:hypothetical protein